MFPPKLISSMNQLMHIKLLRKNQCKETNSIFQQSFPKNILHTMQSKRDRYIESGCKTNTRKKQKWKAHTHMHTQEIFENQ
jgi:hypothetical protein